jgi:hypothetical protein
MLSEAPPRKFKAACDKCGSCLGFAAADHPAARAELAKLGWLEAAVKARVRERWLWWCPDCKPKPSSGVKGRSTI